jgi:hypothetical protein
MLTPAVSKLAGTSTCLICDAPLSWSQARNSKLCFRAECAWRYSLLKKQNKLCRICGRPLSDQDWASGTCAAPDCRRAALARQAHEDHEQRVRQEQKLREQAQKLRDHVMNRFGIREPKSFLLAVIPAAVHRVTRLPAQRRREFRDHLQSLIDRAASLPVPPTVDQESVTESALIQDARLQAASGNACACCQGSCCRGGAYTHAYLGVETLQRYMATHPNQSPRQILAAYLRHMGDETCEGSCVYHRTDGCSLPRDMRANICNEFYCGGLREFRENVPTTGPVRGFFVATTDDAIQRAALVHEEQILMIPAPPANVD